MNFWMIIALPIFYFSVSWFLPWERIQFHSTISVSYLFDLILISLTALYYKKRLLSFGRLKIKGTLLRVIAVILYGFICLLMVKKLDFNAPFKYIELTFIQLVLLAPFIEELLFRGVFFLIGRVSGLNKTSNIILNSLFFSVSHLPAIWFLPPEFHNFIFFQLFYTFGLGWLCVKARDKTDGIFEPYLLHLIFNIQFYIAVKYYAL